MVANMFGDEHPAVVPYNGNLITSLSIKMTHKDKTEEEKTATKTIIKQIIEKNLDIATKTYGEDSIHLLFHLSSALTNRIALGEITSPTEANPAIKQMKTIIAKFHGGHPGKLSNQLFFTQQLLYCQLLESTPNGNMGVNIEIQSVLAEIYTYVLSAQVHYCKLNMKHPFLESTYLNLAVFHRSMKKFGESLMMWKRLESLQKDIYGPDSMALLYAYKNIGTCYLGIGQSDGARRCFKDCISLVEHAEYDHDKEEVRIKDKEEIAQLNQNLYLTYVSDRDYENAMKCTDRGIELLTDIYGPRSKKLSSKYYQKANSQLILKNKDNAIENIHKAIDLFENYEEDKYKPAGMKDTE